MARNAIFVTGRMDFRGSTIHTLNLARALQKHGMTAHVVAAGGKLERRFEAAGVPLYLGEFLESALPDPFLQHRLFKMLDGVDAELVHVMSPRHLQVGRRIAHHLGVPCVVTIHGARESAKDAPMQGGVDAIVAVSEAVREDLVNRRKVPKESITIIPNGVDPSGLPHRSPLAGDRQPVIGSLGRLEKVRGFDYFLEAASRMLTEGTDARFLIAGDGPERDTLGRAARQLGLPGWITFAEAVTDSAQILGILDIFVLPSLREGLGQFLLDAMACAVPVVATAVGGVYSVIEDEKTGLLVNRGDPDALAAAIRRLLGDRELARSLGENARELVLREFGMEKVVEATLELYEQLLVAESSEKNE